MKNIVFTVVFIGLFAKAFSQTAFTLSGKIDSAAGAWISLKYFDNKERSIVDSCKLTNGKFVFKGDINGGLLADISVYKPGAGKGKTPNTTGIFIEPGDMTAEGSYNHIKDLIVKGSRSNDEYRVLRVEMDAFNKTYADFSREFDKIYGAYEKAKKGNAADKTLDSIYKILKPMQEQREVYAAKYESITRNFIETHPNSYVSPFEMRVYTSMWPIDSVKMLFNNFSPAVQYSYYGRQIQKKIAAIDSKSASTVAPDFTATDINGKKLNLANFKGRYVLLDFWASWCLPCRESSPHLIELYKKYKSAGFDVIAIAEDDNAIKSWKKAIQKDGTSLWHNVLAGRQNNTDSPNSITYKFSIGSLPTKILIDKNGIIIGRYMEADEKILDEKLAAVFAQH